MCTRSSEVHWRQAREEEAIDRPGGDHKLIMSQSSCWGKDGRSVYFCFGLKGTFLVLSLQWNQYREMAFSALSVLYHSTMHWEMLNEVSKSNSLLYRVSTNNALVFLLQSHKHVALSRNNSAHKYTIQLFRWNVQTKTVKWYTHILTLPTTLKQASLLPDPVRTR